MKQQYLIKTWHLIMVLSLLNIIGCTDKWDEHYDSETMNLSNETIIEYMKSRSDLSEFTALLERTGYDSILNISQTYTVWAPTNDALAGIDLSSDDAALEVVKNHIAKSKLSSAVQNVKPVYMINGKYIDFINNGSGYSFGNSNLIEVDIAKKNGLLHIVDQKVDYLDNIWEYIAKTDGLDSLRKYLYSFDTKVLNLDESELIGYNEFEEPVYDSIFDPGNEMLDYIGSLGLEDSSYTTILLNNDAWISGYDRLYKFFNVADINGIDGDSVQNSITKRLLVWNMAMRNDSYELSALDSVITTTQTVIYNPGYLSEGLDEIKLSNGKAYVTDELRVPDTTMFLSDIRIEAEYSTYRDNANNEIDRRYSYGSGLDISNDSYLYVESTSTSALSPSSVSFNIPNVYSTKYNVYCIFVPNNIVNTAYEKKSRVKFKLTYIRSETGRTRRTTITPENNIIEAGDTTKMLVTTMDFEFADLLIEGREDPIVNLEIISDVATEDEEFTPNMLIDAIVFEPVVED